MPNPSVSFRVERKDLVAWQRAVALLRRFTPEEAERRLRTEDATGSTRGTTDLGRGATEKVDASPDPTGVRFVEAKVLAALGRLRLPVETKAKVFLKSHGLPDTVENRCTAMVEALTVMVGEKVDEWSTTNGGVPAARPWASGPLRCAPLCRRRSVPRVSRGFPASPSNILPTG